MRSWLLRASAALISALIVLSLTVPLADSGEPATVRYTVRPGDALSLIAARHGTTVGEIMAANGLHSTLIYAGQTLTIPGPRLGTDPARPPSPTDQVYLVKPGDALSLIAEKYGVTVSQLVAANGLASFTIYIGQKLVIPGKAEPRAGTGGNPGDTVSSGGQLRYRVQPGDALSTIAASFGVSVRSIMSLNGLTSTRIYAGQVLAIPQGSPIGQAGQYRVLPGDSLSMIAARYGTSVQTLRFLNGLRGDLIYAGQTLLIPVPRASATSAQAAKREETSSRPGNEGEKGDPPPAEENLLQHRVKQGDTIWGLARHYGISETALLVANNLKDSFIYLGQVLKIPTGGPGEEVETDGPLRGRTVVVDPGHGGSSYGTRGAVTGIQESDVVLDIGLRLEELLEKAGARVVMTRRTKDLPRHPTNPGAGELAARVAIAEQSQADILVSIHNNWFPDPAESGIVMFYYWRNSSGLAASLAAEMSDLGMINRGTQFASFYVLRNLNMPGVLAEIGFMSNARDEGLLTDPGFRQRVAEALMAGIVSYFR